MKINKFTVFSLAAIFLGSLAFVFPDDSEEKYFPRANTYFTHAEQGIKGAQEFLESIRNNRETGFISTEEVFSARKFADKMRKNNKALDITWNFKGPDNVGGRTRAIIVDRNDTSHILTGGVSGGIYESFDGAITWQPYDPDFKIVNVSSMAQGPNGTIYVGTGSGLEGRRLSQAINDFKNKGSSFVGTGLYKLTGNGSSELLVGPSTTNTFNGDWTTVNEIAINPNNADHILVAESRALRESKNGGVDWSVKITGTFTDVQFSEDGKAIATSVSNLYVSTDGGETFTLSRNFGAGRVEAAFAPSNSNIMYASVARVSGFTLGVYRSNDGGLSWEEMKNSPEFFGSGQGFYDNEIAVHPNDPNKVFVGGVGLFQWRQSSVDPAPLQGEWKSIAFNFKLDGARNQFYVHADKHKFVFNPENPNTLYIGSDGGISVSFNSDDEVLNFSESNFGFNVTQFYDIGVGPNNQVIGGTQDNSTPLIGLGFNSGRSSLQTFGGDGFDAHLSTINPEVGIVSSQFGVIARLQGVGTNLQESNLNTSNVISGNLLDFCPGGRCSQAFYTSIGHWESFNHTETNDSVLVAIQEKDLPPIPAGTKIDYVSKNNSWPLTGTLAADLFPIDTLRGLFDDFEEDINPNGINQFIVNFDTVTVDTNLKEVRIRRRSLPNITLNYTVGNTVQWTNVFEQTTPLKLTVNATKIEYNERQITFPYQVAFPDFIQAMTALANVRGQLSDAERNVWFTRDLLKGGNVDEPRWLKIAGANSTPSPLRNGDNIIANEFSRDGNHLFLGTTSGRIYRIDNLNAINVSQISVTAPTDTLVDNVVSCTQINQFSGRSVTGIAIDPNNGNNIVVTLGNYGSSDYVMRSTNALSAAPSFDFMDGAGQNAIPDAPVYDAIIDFRDSNKVMLATELGVFATENAFETNTVLNDNNFPVPDVQWTEENTGMGRAPAMSMQQAIFGFDVNAKNQGKVYVGTHGRGIFETDRLVGLDDFVDDEKVEEKTKRDQVKFYPNPAKDQTVFDFELSEVKNSVNLKVYNLNGQLVINRNLSNLNRGNNKVNLDLTGLENGTYVVRIVNGSSISTGKLIKY